MFSINPAYVVFSIDGEDDPARREAFAASYAAASPAAPLTPLRGCYKGVEEHSYACSLDDFASIVQAQGWADNQESIMIVHPQHSGSARLCGYAELRTPQGALIERIGSVLMVDEAEARAQEAWTHDPARDLW